MIFRKRNNGVDPRGAAQLVADGALIIDVRERGEWKAGRIPGAVHLPLGEIGDRHTELPRDVQLVAVCRSGNRSARATELLQKLGLEVLNLEGGMQAWKESGLPLEPSNGTVA